MLRESEFDVEAYGVGLVVEVREEVVLLEGRRIAIAFCCCCNCVPFFLCVLYWYFVEMGAVRF